jgi:hypothetical protein
MSASVTGRTAKHWRKIDDIKTPGDFSCTGTLA